MNAKKVLVTGATGYVGGELVPALLRRGYSVRILYRSTAKTQRLSFAGDVETSRGDVLFPDTLPAAMEGIQSAYYLIPTVKCA